MNHRLQKIRDDAGQSPIQKLTHKQIMLKSNIPDNTMEPSARSSLTGINQPHLNSYQTRETAD